MCSFEEQRREDRQRLGGERQELRLFGKKDEKGSSANCKTTKTPILCNCGRGGRKHNLIYQVEDLQKYGAPKCDVCTAIDMRWAKAMMVETERWEKESERMKSSPDLLESLKLPPFPDMPAFVAEAIGWVYQDFKTTPGRYNSICEQKLKVFQKELSLDRG